MSSTFERKTEFSNTDGQNRSAVADSVPHAIPKPWRRSRRYWICDRLAGVIMEIYIQQNRRSMVDVNRGLTHRTRRPIHSSHVKWTFAICTRCLMIRIRVVYSLRDSAINRSTCFVSAACCWFTCSIDAILPDLHARQKRSSVYKPQLSLTIALLHLHRLAIFSVLICHWRARQFNEAILRLLIT